MMFETENTSSLKNMEVTHPTHGAGKVTDDAVRDSNYVEVEFETAGKLVVHCDSIHYV